jgi:hypothetical protein
MNQLIVSVAGFTIKLQSDNNIMSVENGYVPFILNDYTGHIDIMIHAKEGIASDHLAEANLLFEARNEVQKFFSIYKHGQSYKIIVFNQQEVNQVQQVALVNHDFSEWTVYSNSPKDNTAVYPLQYPLGPLVFYYLTVKYDAIMIHGSGLFDGEKGRLFSGFSGVGKSTMARLWQQSSCTIINDDRLIIRKEKDGYVMHNTPMFYADNPKCAPLNSINLIKHAPENMIKKLNGATAVSRVMANCIQHGYNNVFIEHHLTFLTSLCSKLAIFDVGFKPDPSIVDFIKINES